MNRNNDDLKVINKIERSRSILEILEDANGNTFYAKSFNTQKVVEPDRRKQLKALVLNDYASLVFMNQIDELVEYVPQFCSGEKETPSFMMTDVGPGIQVDKILLGENYNLAEKALIGLMKTLATVHKATIGKATQFLTIRASLGEPYEKLGGINKCLTAYKDFLERISKHLSIDFPSEAIEEELNAILTIVFKPEDLLGLTHWDPCPDNCMLVEDRVKIYDFESACYANVLIDGLYLSNRFPSCWCFADIPQSIIDKGEKAYRNILSEKVPAINEDSYFRKQKATIMAFWLLQSIHRNLEYSFNEDSRWGIATMRQRTLLRIDRTTTMLKKQETFPNILLVLEQLNRHLIEIWGQSVEQTKVYNAFLEQ